MRLAFKEDGMETMWYYAVGGTDKRGPVAETELRRLIESGGIGPTDLLWSEGMSDWLPLSRIPGLAPAGAPAASSAVLASLPPKLLGWMSFVGVMTLIVGILQCLSCFGIISGIFMIIAGVGLMGARTALASVSHVDPGLNEFFAKLNSYMSMTGICYIITIVLVLAMMVVYALFAAALFGTISSGAF
jgi:hypothetical protein